MPRRFTRPPCSLLIVISILVVGCAQRPRTQSEPDYGRALPAGQSALVKITDPALLPDFRVAFGPSDDLLGSIDGSIAYMLKPSSHNAYPKAEISHERSLASLRRFREIVATANSPDRLHDSLIAEFDVYTSYGYDGRGSVLVTGYCTPIYAASLERTDQFRYPLYRRPPEIITDKAGKPLGRRRFDGTLVPGPTRREIEEKGLYADRDLDFAWLENPIDVFFVHVQGSARLKLPDGTMLYAGYAGKTDQPYVSLGRALVAAGKITAAEISMPAIRRYLDDHPTEVESWLWKNPGYVFFTRYPEGMPHGSLGFPVTPYRSIATDKRIFPRAAPVFLSVEVPVAFGGVTATRRFRAFVLDQDTGGANRAAGRADLYMGVGPDAVAIAGRQKHIGRMYYLFLKENVE